MKKPPYIVILAAGVMTVMVAAALMHRHTPGRLPPGTLPHPPRIAMPEIPKINFQPLPPPKMAYAPAPMPNLQPPALPTPSAPPVASENTSAAAMPSPAPAPAHAPPPLIPPDAKALSPKPLKEINAPTVAAIAQVLAPYADAPPTDQEVAKAFDILKKNHLAGSPPHVPPSPELVDKLGTAIMVGNNARKYLPEMARLNDALQAGDGAARAAITDVWKKMGRSAPSAKDLDKMVPAARDAAQSVMPPPQHGAIKDSDGSGSDIEIDSSPPSGLTRVSVTMPDGPDGKPERVTFTGKTQTQATDDGLNQSVAPSDTETDTTDDAAEQRKKVNGKWTDQDGNPWEISGEGEDITFAGTDAKTGHTTVYTGHWSLGLPQAVHLINDVADIDDSLPGDVKEQLADTFHPPFTLRLKYKADDEEFDGIWLSGQVTYSGMMHTVKIVEDPTWDRPLVLTREIIPEALLFVKAEPAPILVDTFYTGVPLMVGLRFEKPYAKSSYPVKIQAGGGTIQLTAVPANDDRTLFETEAFQVGGQ